MSIDTCTNCGDLVDTDIDADCYPDRNGGCICEFCRMWEEEVADCLAAYESRKEMT